MGRKTLEYARETFASALGKASYARSLAAGAILLAVLWCGVAAARIALAHRELGRSLRDGAYESNGRPRIQLNRAINWRKTSGPLLKRPWRTSFVLYYRNAYASRNVNSRNPNSWYIKLE